jgi:hypothetical protein
MQDLLLGTFQKALDQFMFPLKCTKLPLSMYVISLPHLSMAN